ncbi:hypothetical protein D3C80_1680770 [compost metagenome]
MSAGVGREHACVQHPRSIRIDVGDPQGKEWAVSGIGHEQPAIAVPDTLDGRLVQIGFHQIALLADQQGNRLLGS